MAIILNRFLKILASLPVTSTKGWSFSALCHILMYLRSTVGDEQWNRINMCVCTCVHKHTHLYIHKEKTNNNSDHEVKINALSLKPRSTNFL
jgi:hypothetical protein